MSTTTRDAASLMKHVVTLSTASPGEASAELRVGVRSAPYLADHGFQGMVVLPGSFYIEMARALDRELSQDAPAIARNVVFHRPIILSADDVVLQVDVRDRGDGRVEYAFREASVGKEGPRASGQRYAATLVIDRNASLKPGDAAFSIEDFQTQSRASLDANRFYGQLRENGNEYGPAFQRVVSLWRSGDESLGRISVPHVDDGERQSVHPSVLDAVTQLLASFVIDRGETFILRAIDEVKVMDADLPDAVWGHAVLRQHGRNGESFVGDVRIFDSSGTPYLELSGVEFSFLDRAGAAADETALPFVVAANFTAEPIEDPLTFWGDHFGVPVRLEFAPYNQIFQQLLDPASAMRRSRDGVNVLLLSLEEWAAGERRTDLTLTKERAERCFGDRERTVLPNGLEIVHLNAYETDYLYQEIFEDQTYWRHGIRLPDGATVIDIGANIGLFSLFVMSRCKDPSVYAFEPAPGVHDLLKANLAAYGSKARALNLGVSDRPRTAPFTFYEQSSVFSGFHADEAEDRAAIQTVVRNTLSDVTADEESLEGYVGELTADRLRRSTHEVRLTSVSEIIRENRIEKIDLLKIDAEKSEWDILRGIDERDWPKIEQIVIEIHDRTREMVKRVEALLREKGFRCVVEHERLLEDSGLFNLYATRESAASGDREVSRGGIALQHNVRDFCAALDEAARQGTAPWILCVCPRTPAADADAETKAALDAAEERLLTHAGSLPNVRAISSPSLLERYPVTEAHDPRGHHLGHIPYTSDAFAAIGTAIFRAVFQLKSRPAKKVIVLDCDQTLWKGVCGEEGPEGIELSEPYRGLQKFMLDQLNAGMLLCLCSKNSEQDVWDVFDRRTDMILRREHLASWRINWAPKSANLDSLAQELNVGLDSFIFVDDNPVECADVRAHCPGVLTLQLPPDRDAIPRFLQHVWAFDHAGATEEDRHRTRMYQENAKRERFRGQTRSLKDFMDGLGLRVEIGEVAEADIARVSQLTFRTNQFNFSTIRRSEQEVREFLARDGAGGWVVRVSDRFGDYGLVGVVLYETAADRYRVDTFLLSCRVLGRGVEHQVVSRLAQHAAAEGKRFVELAYRPTERNAPVREFLKSIGAADREETGESRAFAADRLAELRYDPDSADEPVEQAEQGERGTRARPKSGFGAGDPSELLQGIAERLCDVGRIAGAIEQYRLRDEPAEGPVDAAPGDTLEAALLSIWRQVLGRSRIGVSDNFFEVGGTSLRAVQVIARIKKDLKHDLSVVSLFESPTVASLAARLSAASDEPEGASRSQAAERGQRRRRALQRGAS